MRKQTIKTALKCVSNQASTESERKETLFRVGFEVGGNLLNKVWQPNKAMLKEIDTYFNRYFKGNIVIGLQLRYGDNRPKQIYLDEKKDTKKFIECALEIEQVYLNKNISSIKWFIASDRESNALKILNDYPDKTFITKGSLSHIEYSTNGLMRTILDNQLLSMCNEIVVTGGSTFGWVAAMKMQKLPFYINGFTDMRNCLRATLSDPPRIPSGYSTF